MKNKRLTEEHRFLGRVRVNDEWHFAIIILQPDLELHIFLPMFPSYEEIPKIIEGQIEDWNIKINNGFVSVSFRYYDDFNSLSEKINLGREEKIVFQKNDYKKIWAEITLLPKICTFTKIESPTDTPDEWGITFYPAKNNDMLFHFFNNYRNPQDRLPNIFSINDGNLYFSNKEQWTIISIQKRLKLLTSCVSFFTGAPVSYELLVGRYKKEVLFIQFKNESNPYAYVCPSRYNSRIEIKENFLPVFSSVLIKKVEDIFNDPNREKILKLLSYFKMLYITLYKEAKIALSFQLMESLANYKEMQLRNSLKNNIIKNLCKKFSEKMCSTCNSLIQGEIKSETDDFDKYIGEALDAIRTEESFVVNPNSIKEIARKYRNELFHGNFFEDMTEIDNLVMTLPDGYRKDLPLVLQAIVTMIGVNFILGIEFNQLIALKSSNKTWFYHC
ncbi:MAG: hypothetical protein HYV59_16385 [Planctomycetes bacterium]|nr:hypothetical protein [Planctomycetota bacterium]